MEKPIVYQTTWITSTMIAATFFLIIIHGGVRFLANVYLALSVCFSSEKYTKKCIAFSILIFYVPYTIFFYYIIIDVINWNAMREFNVPLAFARSIFSHKWRVYLVPEIFILTLIAYSQIVAAIVTWYFSPSKESILTFFNTLPNSPNITIIMPIYNEPLPSLMEAINSTASSKYPLDRIQLIMAFDDDKQSDLYLSTLYCLLNHQDKALGSIAKIDYQGIEKSIQTLKKTKQMNIEFPEVFPIAYHNVKITVCRFPHGGKRHAQECAFRLLQKQSTMNIDKALLLFIDSDVLLDEHALHMLAWEFVKPSPKHKTRPWGVTGLILCKTKGNWNILAALQDADYISSYTLERPLENYLGSVTCLPGILTMMSWDGFERVSAEYFDIYNEKDSTFNYARAYLGEDRYLTYLFIKYARIEGATVYQGTAMCETEAVPTLESLIKQRRRWWLARMTNCMSLYSDPVMWRF